MKDRKKFQLSDSDYAVSLRSTNTEAYKVEDNDSPVFDHRFYKTPLGEYPSVTTVCKVLQKGPQLEAWKKRVGPIEADRLRNRGALRGTAMHSAVEHYISGQDMSADLSNPITQANFKAAKPTIDAKVSTIYCFEAAVFCPDLETAGRLDLFADYTKRPTLIDIKTTTKLRDRKYYHTYCLQCSAYCKMLEYMTGIVVEDFVLIFATDEGESFVIEDKAAKYIDEFKAARMKYKELYGR